MKLRYSLPLIAVLIVPLCACRDTRAIDAARARLDLARHRTDLREMFLALRELQSLQVKDQTLSDQLARVQSALQLEQQMEVEKADHNHEAAIKSAAAVLDLFPDHLGGRKTLKESGLIYRSLEAAVASLRQCFTAEPTANESDPATPRLITIALPAADGQNSKRSRAESKAGDAPKRVTDFRTLVLILGKAGESVERAKTLDPQFERAIAVAKLVDAVEAFGGIAMADQILFEVSDELDTCNREIDDANDWIKLGMEAPYARSPWKYWSKAEHYFKELAKVDEDYPSLMRRSELVGPLLKLHTQNRDYFGNVAELSLLVSQLRKLIEAPSGTVGDYRRSVAEQETRVVGLSERVKTSRPNDAALSESAAAVISFQLYQNPMETQPIIERYKGLLES